MVAVSTTNLIAVGHHAVAEPEQIEAIVKVFAEVLGAHGGLLKREAFQLLADPAELRRKLMEFKRFNLQGIYEGF